MSEEEEKCIKIFPFCGICGVDRKAYEKGLAEGAFECLDCLWVIEIDKAVWEVEKMNEAS